MNHATAPLPEIERCLLEPAYAFDASVLNRCVYTGPVCAGVRAGDYCDAINPWLWRPAPPHYDPLRDEEEEEFPL